MHEDAKCKPAKTPAQHNSGHFMIAMAELSSFTHKFRANDDPSQQNGGHKVARRNRQPVSCQSCRSRKLKCDRRCPCETCTKRGEANSCYFGPNFKSSPGKSGTAQNMKAQDRLRNLEEMVMQMMNTSPDSGASVSQGMHSSGLPPSAYPNPIENGLSARTDGHLQVQGNESSYVGSTHWSTILDNIQDLKSVIVPDSVSDDRDPPNEVTDPDTLFSASRPPSLAQVLQVLPPRVQVDRLMSAYFNAKYAIVPILHTYAFQRQYEQFWTAPLETPPLWISMMFSIMGMASILQVMKSQPTASEIGENPKDPYLIAAAQCLILGGYTRPRRFVIEALLLFTQLKYSATLDPSREVGLIFTIIIRLAFRMGYHRDPSNFPHISTFDGEMRRRAWGMCKMFDLMIAFQLGLPSNIPVDSWDTRLGSNLADSDFDENTSILPSSRPETEATPMLYFIVKSRLMTVFSKVCHHALSMKAQPEATVRELDVEVQQAYQAIPSPLKYRRMAQSFADPSSTIMFRLNIEFLYQKSILVLHRKYMAQGREDSRTVCVSAAIAILGHLADIHKEFQQGGQMEADRWMISSFTMNDFVLAAMIVCLALSLKCKTGLKIYEDDESRVLIDMLKQSYFICLELGHNSREGKRISVALGSMLSKMEPGFAPNVSGTGQHMSSDSVLATLPTSDAHPLADNAPFGNMLDGPENIDWAFLDQYLLESSPEDQTQNWISTPVPGFGGTAMGVHVPTT